MDAVSGLFLNALGTDMVTMEEYFPFITKAFDVMQYTAWAVLFLIVVWQLFRAFGGPITEAENPWQLVVRGAIFALLIGYAKPIFMLALDIARAPYTALMDVSMTAEEFTFAGVEQVLSNGLLTIVSTVTVVGPILVLILLIDGITSSCCWRQSNGISWSVCCAIPPRWHSAWAAPRRPTRSLKAGAGW